MRWFEGTWGVFGWIYYNSGTLPPRPVFDVPDLESDGLVSFRFLPDFNYVSVSVNHICFFRDAVKGMEDDFTLK